MANFQLLTAEQLSEYDLIICLDKSGSMSFDGVKKGMKRWDEGEEFVRAFAEFADEVDDDGITVITFGGQFNPKTDVVDGVTAEKVHDIFKTHRPSGSTPMGKALQAAVDKHFSSQKKTIVLVATDGVPDNEQEVKNVIINASNKIKTDGELTFLFVQIGNDAAASRYLDSLDDDLQKEGAKFDIVDAINQTVAEGMTYEQMLSKALVD